MTLPQPTSPRATRNEWQAHLRGNESMYLANDAPPRQLYFLATIYFGHSKYAYGKSPRERLWQFLEDDGLVELVLSAFADVMNRSDLPSVQEALDLAADHKIPFLAWPLLAGLEQLALQANDEDAPLEDSSLRQALAIRALYDPAPHKPEPKWHRWTVTHRPNKVAATITMVYKAALRGGTAEYYGLYALAHDAAYAEVARLSVASLLRTFATRASSRQLEMLTPVLAAAFSHCDADEFCAIINSKLTARSMGTRQRLHWLCAGLILRPATYLSPFDRELAAGAVQRRIRYVAEFLGSDGINNRLARLDDVRAAALLIRRMGPAFRPFPVGAGPRVYATTPGDTTVAKLIDAIARTPDAEGTALLDELTRDPALVPWHERLRRAAWQQRVARRDTGFRYPQVREVVDALAGNVPANATDLAALAYHELASLGRDIRDGQTSDWQQYWHTDAKPWRPLSENRCRDRLLSDLSVRLRRFDVWADKEPTYADDKRADIRIASGAFNVPVEIKKSDSRGLWDAIRSQLIPKYTRDPHAAGHGIYLVFWFGQSFYQPSKTGKRPEDAASLQAMLTGSLTEDELRRIKVLVIDVSQPHDQTMRPS